MKQEDKELLLKDLCYRLPYKVKALFVDGNKGYISIIEGIDIYKFIKDNSGMETEISDVKPYLFPLSSMTEEQRNEYHELLYNPKHGINIDYFDWCHKNHLDCRGLIGKGLAIDTSGLNIY